jgi:hypothetical protein
MVVGCKPSAVESTAKLLFQRRLANTDTTTIATSGEISLLIRTYKIWFALQNNQELQITLQEIEIAKMKLELEGFYYQR